MSTPPPRGFPVGFAALLAWGCLAVFGLPLILTALAVALIGA